MLLRFLLQTVTGSEEAGREADWPRPPSLRRTAGLMLLSRQRPHSVPNHRHKVSRDTARVRMRPQQAPTPVKAKACREISWTGRAPSPSSEGARCLDSVNLPALGQGVGHRAARGRSLTLRQASHVLIGWVLLSGAVIGLAPATLPLHLRLGPDSVH